MFRIQPNMNKFELKAYLQQIYNVDVVNINTKNQLGKETRVRLPGGVGLGNLHRKPAYKLAYVTLGEESEFEFPDLWTPTEGAEEGGNTM